MGTTVNYGFEKHHFGYPVQDAKLGDNLDLIDTVIKARENEIDVLVLNQDAMHSEGASTFAGPSGRTITHNLNISDYDVSIKLSADGGGAIGEIWVTDEAVNSFVVRNSGSGVTAFTWCVHRQT